jgi:hypothetical protein
MRKRKTARLILPKRGDYFVKKGTYWVETPTINDYKGSNNKSKTHPIGEA